MSAVSQKADTICRGCDQAFYSLDQLMYHRLTCCPGIDTASTDQLFGCRICGLVTNRLFMVKRHCRESHGDDSDLLLVATLHQRPDVQLLAPPVSVQTAASVASAPVASEPVASATAAAAALTVQSQPDTQQSVSQPSKKRLRASRSPSVSQSSVEARPAKRKSLSTAEAGSSKRSSISSEKNARSSNSRTRKAASRAAVRHSLPATASKKAKSRKSLNSAKLLESQNSVALKTEQKSVCAFSAASAAAVAKKTRTRAAAVAAAVATTAAILNGGRHNGRHASSHNPSEQKSASSPAAAPASSAASSGSKSKTPSSKAKTQSNSKPRSKPAPRICVSHKIFSAMSAASGDVRVRLGRLPQAVLDQLHRNGKFVLPAGSGADDFATDAARTCSSTSMSAEEQQAQQQRLVDQLPPAPVVEPPPEPVMSPLLPVSMVGDEPLRLPDTSQPPIDGVSIDGDGNCGRDGELVDDDERYDTDKSQATATEEMHSEAVGLQLVTVPLEAL